MLGSDMIETPQNTGKQNTIAFSLNEKINKDTMVSLMKDDEAIITFTAPKCFKTISISTDSLVSGDYQLYTEDFSTKQISYGINADNTFTKENSVSVNNQNNFTVSQTVNSFGK